MLDELRELGVDVDSLLELFGGNVDAYCEILNSFLNDIINYDVEGLMQRGDYETACQNSHALKGASGNLRIDPLFKMYTDINQALKQNDIEAAQAALDEGIECQRQIVECIKRGR